MTSTYLAHTPYHVLLASALAADSSGGDRSGGDRSGVNGSEDEHHLLGVRDADMTALLDALRVGEETPFDRIESIPGNLGLSGLRMEVRRKRTTARVRRYVRRERPDRLYSFNDRQPVAQGAFDAASDRGGVRRIYVEDGTSAYARFDVDGEWSWSESLKTKLFYGFWRENTTTLGTSSWVDEARAVFPDHVLPELRERPIESIPREAAVGLGDADWFRRYVRRNLDAETLDGVDALVFLTHSEYVEDVSRYADAIEALVRSLERRGHGVGVKYHPREETRFLGVDRSDAALLAPGVPAEVLFVADPSVEFVAGTMSTALLTARWLLDDAAVVSLMDVVGQPHDRLGRVFERLGVRVPATREELTAVATRTG
jgi:hypothetical protein